MWDRFFRQRAYIGITRSRMRWYVSRFSRQRAYIGITRSCMRWYVRKKNPSLAITDYHHSASLVMPIGDPRGGFFYPTLILMKDTYNLTWVKQRKSRFGVLEIYFLP